MNIAGRAGGLEVSAGGRGVVSHAGLVLLRHLTDKTGLTTSNTVADRLEVRSWRRDQCASPAPGWPPRCSPSPCCPGCGCWPSTGRSPGAEPKTPRHRILHGAARLAAGGRHGCLEITPTWPWATAIVTAWDRIAALPQAP